MFSSFFYQTLWSGNLPRCTVCLVIHMFLICSGILLVLSLSPLSLFSLYLAPSLSLSLLFLSQAQVRQPSVAVLRRSEGILPFFLCCAPLYALSGVCDSLQLQSLRLGAVWNGEPVVICQGSVLSGWT